GLAILPVTPFLAKPRGQVRLRRPFSPILQCETQSKRLRSFFRIVTLCTAFNIDIKIIERLERGRILFPSAHACIRCAACVAGETRRSASPFFELPYEPRVAEQ